MSLWICVEHWWRRGAPAAAVVHRRPDDPMPPPTEPERAFGCGWFDSSLDLRQGLAVIEHQDLVPDLAVQLMLAT
ncbi:MAG: hypothetical protein LCI02_13435 [Proteobacteria bacterium]|nr:hypothetical protein [Pseudomonadota bacterium]